MTKENKFTALIIGGGAAGFFGAIACADKYPEHRVVLIEKSRQVLSKVRISGGGRCNVTHACFDPALLVKYYPRGSRELRGPFSRFQPRDTINWFETRRVKLKAEEDGRMFPTTDQSDTVIQCLVSEAKRVGVELLIGRDIIAITRGETGGFILHFSDGEQLKGDSLLIATGSAPKMFPVIEKLGHTIIPLVPSLFTFNVPNSPFLELAGISVPNVLVTLPQWGIEQSGALLFTHWGFSGPAILKLSAWAARELHEVNYNAKFVVNWVPDLSSSDITEAISSRRRLNGAKQVIGDPLFNLPKQLWRKINTLIGLLDSTRWSALTHKQEKELLKNLTALELMMSGKTTYKQEFVTCGGVDLKEIDFKTMGSKKCPGLFFAGEVLNIDGVTGGFNFQNAWTTGWIAGNSMFS